MNAQQIDRLSLIVDVEVCCRHCGVCIELDLELAIRLFTGPHPLLARKLVSGTVVEFPSGCSLCGVREPGAYWPMCVHFPSQANLSLRH